MSWAFLVVSVVGLLLTWNTFRPAGGWVRLPAFFASWFVNELALYTIAWQVFATLVFMSHGALERWPGVVGLLVAFVSWAGLLVLWRRGYIAARTMREALGEHAGRDSWPRVPGHKLWLPLWPARPGVRRRRNVVFSTPGGRPLELDVYLPPDLPPTTTARDAPPSFKYTAAVGSSVTSGSRDYLSSTTSRATAGSASTRTTG